MRAARYRLIALSVVLALAFAMPVPASTGWVLIMPPRDEHRTKAIYALQMLLYGNDEQYLETSVSGAMGLLNDDEELLDAWTNDPVLLSTPLDVVLRYAQMALGMEQPISKWKYLAAFDTASNCQRVLSEGRELVRQEISSTPTTEPIPLEHVHQLVHSLGIKAGRCVPADRYYGG